MSLKMGIAIIKINGGPVILANGGGKNQHMSYTLDK